LGVSGSEHRAQVELSRYRHTIDVGVARMGIGLIAAQSMKPSIDAQQVSSIRRRSAVAYPEQAVLESLGRLGRGTSAHDSGHDDDCSRQGCYDHEHAERRRRRHAVISPEARAGERPCGNALARPQPPMLIGSAAATSTSNASGIRARRLT
jgi:hypothetical protein